MTDDARFAFAEVIGDGEQTVLLMDHSGRVRAGVYLDEAGGDVASEIAASLAGVGAEATRAMRHLAIGEWRAIVCECTDANLALGPTDDGDVVLVAAAPSVPPGFVRRLLDRASRRAISLRRDVA